MEVFLNEDDILKPEQNDQDYGNIKHFFVSREKKAKQTNKKISLLKPRRSDQLPDFEAMILSGESDDELPAIFDKKDTVNGKVNDDSINITDVASKHTVVTDKDEERNRPRKRNTSCNTSVIKVIADTDVCDFVENVNNLSTINEENNTCETNPDHVNTEDEQVNIVSDSGGFYDLESPDSTETNQNEKDIHFRERCENFTKLLPTFFPCPADMMTSPQKISDVDKDILFIVPEAPSLNELNQLVDDISYMTTLPKIDIGKLIEEWEKEGTKITDRKYVLNDRNNIINNKIVGNADSLKNINKFDNMTDGRNLSTGNSEGCEFDESFVYNDNKETNLTLQHMKKIKPQPGNKRFDTFNYFESHVKGVVIETSHKISGDLKSSCDVQRAKENVNDTSKTTSNVTMVMEAVKSKYLSSIVPKEDVQMNVDVNKMTEDVFSGSDEDFMDTQANFMLENDDLLADLNSDESSDEDKSKADDSFNTNDNPDVSMTDKQCNLNNENAEVVPIQNRNISVLCQSADALLFDDSFMDTSVLENAKTSIVDDRKPNSGSVESDGRIPSPSQFTFTQALACVHDSDSLDRDLGRITPNGKQMHETKTGCKDSNFTAIKEHKNKIDSEVHFTTMKPHTTLNDGDILQLNLINDVVDIDNTENFSDVDEETELPLFDLGFDVDDDIIPPSPCMNPSLSQKSILKNSNQSVFSSRKSLSFLCDKSKIFESRIKKVLSPTREEVQQSKEDRIDTEIEKEQDSSYGFDVFDNEICEKSNNSINEQENIVKNKDQSEHNDPVSCLNDYFDNDSICDLQDDFEMLPTSPVLSGKRPSGHKHVILPFDDEVKTPLISKSKSPQIAVDISLNNSPSLDDSFVVRKKRKTTFIIDSPVAHNEKDDFDDFKTPVRPASAKAKTKHKFSSSSSEEESILKIKKSMKTVSFCVVDERDDDFEGDLPGLCDKKKRNSKGIKRSPDKWKRKSKSPANQFLVCEAEVSENEEVSTDDEDGSDLDQMEESFVSEGCTQLSQGQHDELQAIYLQSVRSPAGQDGRFKLQYDYDDNIDVYSQVSQDEESQYYDDSFVDDDVEENSLLDGHEITVLSRDNIIDNESYVGPRTRWSKPNRSQKMLPIQCKNRRKRVKRITDSSSEDEQCRNTNMSPAIPVRKDVLVSPAMIGQLEGKMSRSNKRQLISSSDEEQDQNQDSDSSEIMCSLKTKIADKQKSVESHCGRDLKQIHDDSSKSKVQLTITNRREERINRQKEKQEEFKRNMITKQQSEKIDEKNSIVGNKSTSPSNVNDITRFSETSQLTDDSDLLLSKRHTDSKPVVIVDSREINGAQDIISALRFQHNLHVIVAQLDSCDYVVSIRMGIDRKQWSEFSNGSNCAKMTACVQVMCDFYERPCLIIEKDKLKGDEKSRILHWTKYVDKTLVQLIHSKVTLFFTENQLETASIIADLCQLENRKNCAISCQVDLNTEQQNKMKFYKSIPHLSYVHSLFLCNNFLTVTRFLRSDIKAIMTNGKMTEERAANVYNYIRRTFDSQMLPSSYN